MKSIFVLLLYGLIVVPCSPASCLTVKPIILRQISHDRFAFTQGLVLHGNILYESTGLFGKSAIRSLSDKNGKLLMQKQLPEKYFGEGLALLHDKLYQLTWKSGVARVYLLPRMDFVKTLSYPGEGWGITTVGNNFVMSNGTNMLYVLTEAFKLIEKISVHYENNIITRLNELEFANGKIYANKWKSNYIFEIDYPTGEVTKIIDCTDIAKSLTGLTTEDVLNGIAYNPYRNSFYITGKNWPAIFEVKFP